MLFSLKKIVSVQVWLCLIVYITQAAILPLTLIKNSSGTIAETEKFGHLEYQPNGKITLRSTLENDTNVQSLLLLHNVLNAMKVPPVTEPTATMLNIKIYGDGTEQKFPPILENIIQRIQTYFSVYRYTDTSRPLYGHGVTPNETSTKIIPTVNVALMESTTSTSVTTTVLSLEDADVPEYIVVDDNNDDGYITVGED